MSFSYLIYFTIITLIIFTFSSLAYGQKSQDQCFNKDVSFQKITTTYDILIPFSSTNFTVFEPNEISIPVNTNVRWINLNNYTYNIVVLNGDNKSNPYFDFQLNKLGGIFNFNFSEPGVYTYHNKDFKSSIGKITVGDAIQKGKFMTMTIGSNLPLKDTEFKRILLSIKPNFEATNLQVPSDGSIKYNVTIINPYGVSIYNKEITDVDGLLYVELIPFPSTIYGSQSANSSDIVLPGIVSKMKEVGSQSDFITWGFMDSSETPNCLKGIVHIMGPVLVDFEKSGLKVEKPYSMSINILEEKNNSLTNKGYHDIFILPNK